jgi:hypothetical protein
MKKQDKLIRTQNRAFNFKKERLRCLCIKIIGYLKTRRENELLRDTD